MNDERFPYDAQSGGRSGQSSDADPGTSRNRQLAGADELDDRLLALALGLDEDAELRAQLAASSELRARFQRLQDELAAVEDGVRRVVPEPPRDWSDLAHERWSALRPFVRTQSKRSDARTPQHRRAAWWRRWQALAPAAAAVLIGAAVIGVVMSDSGLQTARELSAPSSADKAAEGGGVGVEAQPSPAARALTVTGASDFRTIVVARAGAVEGSTQTYTLERTLKGESPSTLQLETEIDGRVTPGSLAVLFLDPTSDATPCPTPQVLSDANRSAPVPSAGQNGESAPLYLYDGRCAALVTLPEYLTAADVLLE